MDVSFFELALLASRARVALFGGSILVLCPVQWGKSFLLKVDSATSGSVASPPQELHRFVIISPPFLSYRLPSALCAPPAAVNPCLDPDAYDYRCELDASGSL